MTRKEFMRNTRNTKQKGQAIVEYTVICALVLVFALLTPLPGGSESVADMLIRAVKTNHEAKVKAIGQPRVGSDF
ncbi:MAG: hypothetical protein FWD51_00365 [Betaproteobacteria bacterium]|nr:hypothetical protein [Betaproteobacteria bacterium]